MSVPTLFEVRFDEAAERDLEEIADYVAEHASRQTALELIRAIRDKADTLATFPRRGAVPKELDGLGFPEYRQTLLGRYRIFFEITQETVVILLIADGRRDMEMLLRARLVDRPVPR